MRAPALLLTALLSALLMAGTLGPVATGGPGGAFTPAAADTVAASPPRPSARAAAADSRLRATLSTRSRAAGLGSGASLRVTNRKGETLFETAGGATRMPASTMKVLTATVALRTLGPDWRPRTVVHDRLVTPPGGGRARTARVVVEAGGDPLLTASDLRALARRTATAMPATVDDVVLWLDDDLFAAPSAATGWERGDVPFTVRPVRPLALVGSNSGDAGVEAIGVFAAALRATGVNVRYLGRADVQSRTGYDSLATYTGHTLGAAVDRMLQISDNDIAEMLFKLSALATGRPATWSGAQEAARAELGELGITLAGSRLLDGSGLSRSNRLTVRTLSSALVAAITPGRPALHRIYFGRAMAVAGRTGTLASRFGGPANACARGVVVAKTGTLRDTISLAGVTRRPDGRLATFAFIVSPIRAGQDSVRAALDRLAATVTGCG